MNDIHNGDPIINQPTSENKSCKINESDEQQQEHLITIPTINDNELLKEYGVVKASISSHLDVCKWANEFSQVTPLNFTSEGDNEYAFYRNILDEPDFPFGDILDSSIGDAIKKYFGENVKDLHKDLRLDDAFCIHYNMSQRDTTCAKHRDPSDITVNLCLERSEDVAGSDVLFYGTQSLRGCDSWEEKEEKVEDDDYENEGTLSDFKFLVSQEAGVATIHYGCHPHETMPLKSGRRTNIVLTYCYTDESKSDVSLRTCFF